MTETGEFFYSKIIQSDLAVRASINSQDSSEQAVAHHEANEEGSYHHKRARSKFDGLLRSITPRGGDALVDRLRKESLVVCLAANLRQLW